MINIDVANNYNNDNTARAGPGKTSFQMSIFFIILLTFDNYFEQIMMAMTMLNIHVDSDYDDGNDDDDDNDNDDDDIV